MARRVVDGLNVRHHQEWQTEHPNCPGTVPYDADIAHVVPLDGHHLTRAQLAAMPDPEEAAFRRGAPFTFDGHKYRRLVQQLRQRILPESTTIYAPSFDHAIKDPVEDDIAIPPSARVVVFEGLYVAVDDDPWRDAAQLMDMLWFVDVAVDVAVERLVRRHVAAGTAPDAETARSRALRNDMPNGRYILDHRLPIQEMIASVEEEDNDDDGAWRPHEGGSLELERKMKTMAPHSASSLGDLAVQGGGC